MARAAFPAFGERLRELFRQRGLTNQSAFGRDHGFTQGKVSRWLRGSLPETQEDLERLAIALDVPWQWLLIGDEGLKAMGARDPVIMQTSEREFAVASYLRTTSNGVALYGVKRKNREIKSIELAETRARQEKEEGKL